MKRIIIALVAAAVSTTALADAAATYTSKCAACHGKAGEGAKMAPTPIAGMKADAVKKAITDGSGKMKPVKIDDADAVAKYVEGLKK
jgi:mono/diheme cytochrome c family protein